MYANAHTAVGLAAKRTTAAAPLLGLLVAAQGSELAWVGLSYLGIERPTVDAGGALHLDHLPWSHSLLTGIGGGILLWAALRFLAHRPEVATVFGAVFASHIVLDVVQHEPDIRVVPWLPRPALGLSLSAHPWLDFAVETALCVACWAYFRGTWQLLTGILVLNLTNLPLMLGQRAAAPLAGDHLILPTVILVQTLMALALTWLLARPTLRARESERSRTGGALPSPSAGGPATPTPSTSRAAR